MLMCSKRCVRIVHYIILFCAEIYTHNTHIHLHTYTFFFALIISVHCVHRMLKIYIFRLSCFLLEPHHSDHTYFIWRILNFDVVLSRFLFVYLSFSSCILFCSYDEINSFVFLCHFWWMSNLFCMLVDYIHRQYKYAQFVWQSFCDINTYTHIAYAQALIKWMNTKNRPIKWKRNIWNQYSGTLNSL